MAIKEDTIVSLMFRDDDYFFRVIPKIDPDFFNNKEPRAVVVLLKKFFQKYGKKPTLEVLVNMTKDLYDMDENAKEIEDYILEVASIDEKPMMDWALDATERWLKERAVTNALIKGYEIVESGKSPEPIYAMIEEAIALSLDRDVGHDYKEDWRKRLEEYKKDKRKYPFFLETFNELTSGGMEPGTVNFVVSRTSGGKTAFMVNQARFMAEQGLNVVYFSIEDGEFDISRRLDAQNMGIPIQGFYKIPEERFAERMKRVRERLGGNVYVKFFGAGMPTVVDFKAYLKELESEKGVKPDFVVIDYINLMASSRVTRASSLYEYYKSIVEEVSAFSKEYDIPVLTATQFNRDGARNADPSNEDVADSMGLVFTARFVCALITNDDLKSAGLLGYKILKSKYGGESSGGQLYFDSETGLISDKPIDKSSIGAADVVEKTRVGAKKPAVKPSDGEALRIPTEDDIPDDFENAIEGEKSEVDALRARLREEIENSNVNKIKYKQQLSWLHKLRVYEMYCGLAGKKNEHRFDGEMYQALVDIFGEPKHLREELKLLSKGVIPETEAMQKVIKTFE